MDRRGLRDLAERQHGAFRRTQAEAFGHDARTLATMARRGEAEVVTPRVLRLTGSPSTRQQRAMLAVLDAGLDAAVAFEAAAAWWGLPGFPAEPVPVVRTRRQKDDERYLAEVHEVRRLPPHHVVALDGVPVTSPARTIFDLAAMPRIHPQRVERALDTAWAKRLLGPRALEGVLDDLGGRGRRGIRLMRELIAARGPDFRPPESALERRFQAILAAAGISGFERQVVVGDEVEPIGRIDFVHTGAGVVVEVDSVRFHTSLVDRESDRRRDARLRAGGWTVLRVSEDDVWYRPELVVAAVRRALLPAA